MFENAFVQGIFKEELNNRFLCLVEVNGIDTLCYIPSSCRLSNFIDLSGKEVLLSPNKSSSKTRTEFTVYAFSYRNDFILLNMSTANSVIKNNISRRYFSFLGKRSSIRTEYRIGDYKTDLFIEDTKTIVEVKSILSFSKTAKFPSVYSQRAIDQLVKLIELMDKGYNVSYIFVSLYPRVKQIVISNECEEYHDLFIQCINKGIMVKGLSLRLKDGNPVIQSSLPVFL